jgi:hypothetical protein
VGHRRNPRQARRHGRADVGLVVDHEVGRGLVQEGPQVVDRPARQHVGGDDHPEAPALLAGEPAQLGVVVKGLPLRFHDRDPDALRPEPQRPQSRDEVVPGAEQDLMPGVAAGPGQRQQGGDVPVGGAAAEERAHLGRKPQIARCPCSARGDGDRR